MALFVLQLIHMADWRLTLIGTLTYANLLAVYVKRKFCSVLRSTKKNNVLERKKMDDAAAPDVLLQALSQSGFSNWFFLSELVHVLLKKFRKCQFVPKPLAMTINSDGFWI